MKKLLRWLARLLFGFRAYNEAAVNTSGPVLLLPNHLSWWDWVFIGVCLEDDWRFVTSSTTANLSWIHRRIMVNRRTFSVDMNSPYAVKHMAEYLQQGGRLVLFPEGRMSMTGSLMKLYEGTGFLIFKTRPKVITAHIRGAALLPSSRNSNRKQFFPRISVHFSDVLIPPKLDSLSGTAARSQVMEWLRQRMLGQHFETEMELGASTLPEAIIATARQQPRRTILQDVGLQTLSYRKFVVGAKVLAKRWDNLLANSGQRVGILLPNVNAMPVVLLSFWLTGKIPAILNYTMGPSVLLACARLAGLKQIVTSKTFIAHAKLELKPLQEAGISVVFIEDVRAGISPGAKLMALVRSFLGLPVSAKSSTEDTALILFTSGSEGEPKGVELTHRNILSNIRQMLAVVDLGDTDRFFNALPLFHSFGLTVGLLLPLVQGAFVFLYLSPLHYRVVPSAFYNLNCTVFFGTNTFLSGYGRKAHPYDFHALRYLFAGAEKLQESTGNLWMRKFGARILEGYGATECSPCISVNVPMFPRPGSAGQLLPGIRYRLEPVEGIGGFESSGAQTENVGRLFVRGPNVMRGYLNAEANGKFKALGGWYDTGDIAKVDSDGFVYILGRLKRFAKISGEMVSLTAIEDCLASGFPRYGPKFAVAVIAIPDTAKGEKLIAITNESRLTLEEIREVIRSHGLSNLAVPRDLKVIHDLPRLGTGKLNHRELQRLVTC